MNSKIISKTWWVADEWTMKIQVLHITAQLIVSDINKELWVDNLER